MENESRKEMQTCDGERTDADANTGGNNAGEADGGRADMDTGAGRGNGYAGTDAGAGKADGKCADAVKGKLLLHACCGPCSMEPVRILRERGIEPHIHYSNSNIAPADEYERRLQAIHEWTASEGVRFAEDAYDPTEWMHEVEDIAKGVLSGERKREDRCRACYRQRLGASARYAAEHGYTAIGTTLTISPYQFTDIIREELARAAAKHGLKCAFEDYSPHYSEATRRSREAGMYRQRYCGCAWSKAEAEAEQAERRAAREAEKARRQEARRPQEEALERRRRERAAYDAKQQRKRAILKAMREKNRDAEASSTAQGTQARQEP